MDFNWSSMTSASTYAVLEQERYLVKHRIPKSNILAYVLSKIWKGTIKNGTLKTISKISTKTKFITCTNAYRNYIFNFSKFRG